MKRAIIITTILLSIILIVFLGIWIVGRRTAIKNNQTPESFRAFIGLGTPAQRGIDGGSGLSSDFNQNQNDQTNGQNNEQGSTGDFGGQPGETLSNNGGQGATSGGTSSSVNMSPNQQTRRSRFTNAIIPPGVFGNNPGGSIVNDSNTGSDGSNPDGGGTNPGGGAGNGNPITPGDQDLPSGDDGDYGNGDEFGDNGFLGDGTTYDGSGGYGGGGNYGSGFPLGGGTGGGGGGTGPILPPPPGGGGGGTTTAGSTTTGCTPSDLNITFTGEELDRLNQLQQQFNAVALNLRGDSDASNALANYDSFALTEARIAELATFCENRVDRLADAAYRSKVPTPYWRDEQKDGEAYIDGFGSQSIDISNPERFIGGLEQLLRINLW